MTHYFIRRLRHICLLISAWLFWRETFITESMYVLERQFFHQLSVKKAEQRVNMRKTILHSRHHIIPCAIIIAIYLVLKLRYDFWLSGLWSDQKTINFHPKDLHYINIFCHLAILQKHSLPPESIFERQFFHQLFVEYIIYIYIYIYSHTLLTDLFPLKLPISLVLIRLSVKGQVK